MLSFNAENNIIQAWVTKCAACLPVLLDCRMLQDSKCKAGTVTLQDVFNAVCFSMIMMSGVIMERHPYDSILQVYWSEMHVEVWFDVCFGSHDQCLQQSLADIKQNDMFNAAHSPYAELDWHCAC